MGSGGRAAFGARSFGTESSDTGRLWAAALQPLRRSKSRGRNRTPIFLRCVVRSDLDHFLDIWGHQCCAEGGSPARRSKRPTAFRVFGRLGCMPVGAWLHARGWHHPCSIGHALVGGLGQAGCGDASTLQGHWLYFSTDQRARTLAQLSRHPFVQDGLHALPMEYASEEVRTAWRCRVLMELLEVINVEIGAFSRKMSETPEAGEGGGGRITL